MSAAVLAQNNAQYISDTIPASMIPGLTYNVTITFRNTGTTTWTGSGGYKLWERRRYSSSLPQRVRLGGSENIGPGQTKTFQMTFVAPSAGTYTTSWRMVQESVEWFGDTCTKAGQRYFWPKPPRRADHKLTHSRYDHGLQQARYQVPRAIPAMPTKSISALQHSQLVPMAGTREW